MPSFTLLGSQVLRLPFLLRSSYPHEILHNWWGNSVYPDYDDGNWSEGLTAYLADHLGAEQRGRGAEYRRGVLQKYSDYVSDDRDFALTQFRSRHGSSTEAVGYGKSAMFFHMLRLAMGDDSFRAGLSDFYAANTFKRAGYSQLRRSFERASGRELAATAWTAEKFWACGIFQNCSRPSSRARGSISFFREMARSTAPWPNSVHASWAEPTRERLPA